MRRLVEVFKTFGDLTRLKIIKLLLVQELCVGDVVSILGLSQPTVSQHLRRLKQIGLARERREGQLVFYTIDREAVAAFRERCRVFLEDTSVQAIPEMQAEHRRWQGLQMQADVAKQTVVVAKQVG